MVGSRSLILPDSSAWIEFLRGTGSTVDGRLVAALDGDELIATTEPVVMELFAGARSERELGAVRGLLHGRCRMTGVQSGDFEVAAELHRTCRRGGETIRKLLDCLVAAVAIRVGAEVLHRDRDFDVLARHTGLRIVAG